jgi:tRNA(Arg) A34 adenosine deaminase TadA
MTFSQSLTHAWADLPQGGRAAIEQQWAGLVAGGLPCGSAVVDASGQVLTVGRNHAYDPAGELETRLQYPLQHTRLAHAELNALALLPTEAHHSVLTLWTTQHPCSMCAAAVQFIGLGGVQFIADDLSDDSSSDMIAASRGRVMYGRLGDPLWWTVCNLLFLYTSALKHGERAGNLLLNRERHPELIGLTLRLAVDDSLGRAARSGMTLIDALTPHTLALVQIAELAPR